ncbi:TetR/AcrR family transcriptional regulator [Alkalicoccobacillus porphyridii]|nr:TetR/AcrR family transcriptional regulator [Alkalicoccobacillus porphyridii]
MKHTIIDTALKLFSQEGYMTTSMQRIAEECRISKASLYKYFDSKEDLLIQVFENSLQKMFQRAQEITVDTSLSKKERLKQKIMLELEVNQEQRVFVDLIFRTMPLHQNPNVKELMRRTKAALLNWHKHSLLEAYGEDASSYIWDLVIVFQGTMREYIILMMNDHKDIDKTHIAKMLMAHLDMLVYSTNKPKVVLTSELMSDYERFNVEKEQKTEVELFEQMKERLIIKSEQLPFHTKQEVKQAIEQLSQYFHDPKQTILIEALCLYIDARMPMKEERQWVKQLLKNRENKEGNHNDK